MPFACKAALRGGGGGELLQFLEEEEEEEEEIDRWMGAAEGLARSSHLGELFFFFLSSSPHPQNPI